MASSESEIISPPLLASSFDVHIKPQCRKHVESVILNAGNIKKEIPRPTSPSDIHQERFNPPLEIPLDSNFSVSIRFRRIFRRHVLVSLDPKTVLSEAREKDGNQVYCKTEKDIEVVVGIQSLLEIQPFRSIVLFLPSLFGMLGRYAMRSPRIPFLQSLSHSTGVHPVHSLGPRLAHANNSFLLLPMKSWSLVPGEFRVLIMGKSGIGKSSLINKVFGVSSLRVSATTRSEASIEKEHIVPDNDRLVVHDSSGFEAGDNLGLDGVCNFITDRGRRQNTIDRLHAVWLCLEIPIAGGRVLETGVEEFLRRRDQILGDIPLVVVFTKLDSLVNMLSTQALQAGQFLESDALEEQKREALEKHCFGPIQAAMGSNDVTSVAVSTVEDYEASLSELVGKTTANIQKLEAVHYVAMMAQRVNITLKVNATIAFGEKKYWNMLKDSPNFRGQTMKSCFDVLHKDIVTVWNFKGPQDSLYGESFKEALLKTPEGQRPTQSNVSVVATLVTMIRNLTVTPNGAQPVATGTHILHKLAHSQYKASEDTVRQLMTYIVDLTCVMQVLFLVIAAQDSEVSAELVDIAMRAYEQTYRPDVHDEINKFPVHTTTEPEKQDEVLDKIKELIDKYRVQAEDAVELQRQLQSVT